MQTLTPFIGTGVAYEDDLFSADESSFELSLTPGASYELETPRSKLLLNTQVTYTDNLDEDEFDRLTTLNLLRQTYQLTQRLEGSAGVIFNIQETYRTAFEEAGVAGNASREYQYTFPMGLSYALTDLSTLGLNYSFSIFDYADDSFTDRTSHAAGLGLAHLLTPRTTVTPSVSYAHVQYEARQDRPRLDQDVVTPELALSYLLTERITVGASAGVSLVKSSFAGAGEDDSTRFFVFGVHGGYAGMRTTAGIQANRSIDQTLLGDSLIRDKVAGSVTYAVTRDIAVGVSGFYSVSENVDADGGGTYKAFRVSPVITFTRPFRLSENITLDVGYDMFFALDGDPDQRNDDSYENSNRAFALVTWRLPTRY